jgi:hypothetical protein
MNQRCVPSESHPIRYAFDPGLRGAKRVSGIVDTRPLEMGPALEWLEEGAWRLAAGCARRRGTR